ncbi:MAG TPA: N,N-dimethylformamidase beta subunit family domain-containing protein, partial [Mycobacteriales bacterium]|nr:N,N-dimethylformamidase beta subunit family domain-containing protein [Mycobacteriales bacterium]
MNPVVAENARPGTPGWEISRLAYHHEIEGFAGRVSVVSGAVVPVFVSTTAARFAVHAYRMGYYGGVQARLVWQSAVLPGHRQAPAVIEAPTHTPVARWTPSLQLATLGWPPGDYLLRLDASSGWQSFIPLTVRSAHPPSAAVVLLNAVTTWQAYNHWGGYS